MMTPAELGEACSSMMKDARNEWARLGTLQRHIDGKLLKTWMPEGADSEYRDLLQKAGTPWLAFTRDAIAQGCRVSGYTNEVVWEKAWRANGMEGRQGVINREVVGLGYSFLMLLPGEEAGQVVMRPMSAHNTFAVYTDPWDDYPDRVLYRIGGKRASFWDSEWYYFDDEGHYRFNGSPATPQNVRPLEHGLDYTPVVRIANTLDVDSAPQSSVANAVQVYKRIVDATFTLQMLQRYGAFPQKWMAGGKLAKDENGNALVRPSVDSLLHADGEAGESARFGSFTPADLVQAVQALDAHIKHLSAICQVPPHYLLGAVVNMSAEGIAAAESGYHRNIGDRQDAIGEGYELALRTAADILGEPDAADDVLAHLEWENVTSWSLNQVADAISKLDAVGVDLPRLLQLIPGFSKADAAVSAEGALERRLARAVAPQITPA